MVLRPKPEKREEKERTRAALIRAALGLAATFGFASLSLREVSREAAIAPTSFYRHFGDMEELGLAIVREAVDPALTAVTEEYRKAAGRKRDLSLALAEVLVAAVDADGDLFRFLFAERVGGSKSFRKALAQSVRRFESDLEQALVEPGPSSQTPGTARIVAHATVTIALEAGFEALEGSKESRAAQLEIVREQLRLIKAGAQRSAGKREK